MQERSWVQGTAFGWPSRITVTARLDLIDGAPCWVDVVCYARPSKELLAQWAWPIVPDTSIEPVIEALLARLREAIEHAGKPFG